MDESVTFIDKVIDLEKVCKGFTGVVDFWFRLVAVFCVACNVAVNVGILYIL